jgi:predicted dehydrogenase
MRIIQVGVGSFGPTWLERIQRESGSTLAALVDTDAAALERARSRAGLVASQCFADYREAFAQVEADAVLNATPPAVHHEVALAAFEAGLHVLTEKPIADTMAHGRLMVEAAEQSGRTLMVSQNYRFRPWARTMRELVTSGKFGEPDSISVRFAKALTFDGTFRFTMDHPLVRDMSIHHFDLMRALTGKEPVTVFARTWRPSWSWFEDDPCAAALFEFEDGLEVVYEGSWVTRGRETTWDGYWGVECPDAMIELRGDRVHITPAGHPDQDTEVEIGSRTASGQTAALLEFQEAVLGGREPETSGRDNLRSMAMSFAAMRSSGESRPVAIEEILAE